MSSSDRRYPSLHKFMKDSGIHELVADLRVRYQVTVDLGPHFGSRDFEVFVFDVDGVLYEVPVKDPSRRLWEWHDMPYHALCVLNLREFTNRSHTWHMVTAVWV